MCFNTKCSTFGRSVCYNCSVGSNCVIEVISFSSFSLKCYTLKYFSDEISFFSVGLIVINGIKLVSFHGPQYL